MRTKNYRVLIACVLVTLSCMGANVLAQEFPVKPINLWIGYAPGGGAHKTAIIFAEGFKKYLNQPVVINFKPGATQSLCADFIITSPPDGYNLFWISHGELIAKMAKDGPTLKFRLEDLDSLGSAPYSPYLLAVNKESPFKTIEDLIAAAKKSPGKLNFGSAGAWSPTHLLAELFSMKAEIVLNHVPFTGGGPSITALLGKHVDMIIMSATTFGAHIKPGGGLRPLIVFNPKRIPDLPEVPTATEKQININYIAWWGLQAPKGLPKSVRTTLVQAMKKATVDSEVNERLKKALVGVTNIYIGPEEVDQRIQEEYKLMQDTLNKAGFGKSK